MTGIRAQIITGEFDGQLEEIIRACQDRRVMITRRRVQQLHPGDVILISSHCKPKMLAGTPVIYRGREGTRLKVELQMTYSPKWRQGSIIRIPEGLVGEVMTA